jgi:hypothetical protein
VASIITKIKAASGRNNHIERKYQWRKAKAYGNGVMAASSSKASSAGEIMAKNGEISI